MKTLKFVWSLLVVGVTCYALPACAQQDLSPVFDYFTLKECGNDTLLYLDKNHGSRNVRYYDKPIEMLVTEARRDLPFKSCWIYLNNTGWVIKIVFFFDPAERVKEMVKKKLPIRRVSADILTTLAPHVQIPERIELYRRLKDFGFHKILPINRPLYRVLKDIVVEFSDYEDDNGFGYEKIVE
jgi:hypothetical protein